MIEIEYLRNLPVGCLSSLYHGTLDDDAFWPGTCECSFEWSHDIHAGIGFYFLLKQTNKIFAIEVFLQLKELGCLKFYIHLITERAHH